MDDPETRPEPIPGLTDQPKPPERNPRAEEEAREKAAKQRSYATILRSVVRTGWWWPGG